MIKWSDWPVSAIFSVPEDRKVNAAAWNIWKLHEHNEGWIRKRRSYPSTPDGCTGTWWSFANMLGRSKKMVIINDLFVSYCTVRLVDKAQDTAGNGTSCSGSLHVKCTVLRNESQGKSRKRVEKSLPDNFLKVMFKGSEKRRPEQKSSEPKAKKI